MVAGLAIVLAIVAPSAPACAGSLSVKDVQIIAKVLGFLDPPTADGVVAVAYASGDGVSRADAMAVVESFGNGLKVGNNTVRAEAVDAVTLGSGRRYVAVIAAAGAPGDQVMSVVRALRIPCITGDIAQVQAGRCIMAVRSEPRVDIVLNHELAVSAGISFATAFRMLVHEI